MIARFAMLGFACGLAASAQQPVAPTPATAGPVNGENTGGYNILNSFETGYRFETVNGDEGRYRSDVNYGNGLRLLSGSLRMNSRDGHGRFFDELTLRTQGLGNDPYQYASLHIEKNRLYRYDMLWRSNDYFNPGLPIANGLHFMDTQRRLQDHDLTLLPNSRFQFFVGYSRNAQDGPALSTVHLSDGASAEFPLFEDVQRLENEYRLGAEAHIWGARITVIHGWVNYSENTAYSLTRPAQSEGAVLDQFARSEPYRGSSPYWRANLQKQAKTWSAAARFSYAGSRRNFFFGETAIGADRFGGAHNVQTLIEGAGTRPMGTGSLTLSYFPNSRLTVANQTSFYNTRMTGDNSYLQFDNATLSVNFLNFQFLGIRTITNTTDTNYRAAKWLGLYAGYQFSTRRIRSEEGVNSPAIEQNNDLHAGRIGLRLQPIRALSMNLDAEVGRTSRPIFPISERNYHLLGGRVQYKRRTLLLSAAARTNYNINSISITEHSSRARTYSADLSWTPHRWFGVDAGYSKLHLDTLSGIAYFSAGQLVTGDHVAIHQQHSRGQRNGELRNHEPCGPRAWATRAFRMWATAAAAPLPGRQPASPHGPDVPRSPSNRPWRGCR